VVRRRTSLAPFIVPFIIGVVGLTLAACGSNPQTDSSATTTSPIPIYTDYASVPVVTCATSVGVTVTAHPYPSKSRFVQLPSNLLGQVSFYTDTVGWVTPLLGPANWDCAVSEGADGTYQITLTAPSPNATGAFVSAASDGPCIGCVYSVVCPWLSFGQVSMMGYSHVACPATPLGQTYRLMSVTGDAAGATIFVTDPPAVAGTIVPSGIEPSSMYASQGYLVFKSVTFNPEALTLACALPAIDQNVCKLIESNFISSKWGQHSY
jgi:hypothetical protein